MLDYTGRRDTYWDQTGSCAEYQQGRTEDGADAHDRAVLEIDGRKNLAQARKLRIRVRHVTQQDMGAHDEEGHE